jgi:hypothetical protein
MSEYGWRPDDGQDGINWEFVAAMVINLVAWLGIGLLVLHGLPPAP